MFIITHSNYEHVTKLLSNSWSSYNIYRADECYNTVSNLVLQNTKSLIKETSVIEISQN